MQPTGRDLRVDLLNTQLLVGYRNGDYIADEVFPIVPVNKQGGIIPQIAQSQFFRNLARKRAPGTKSQGSGWNTDLTATYFAERTSFRSEVSDDDRDNAAGGPFELDRIASQRSADLVLLEREIALSTNFFTTSVWGADKVGGTDYTKWSDYAGGTPLVDISSFSDEIEGKVGVEPDTLVIGKQVWVKLKWAPQLVDSIKYTQTGQVSVALAAQLMELRRILVGRAIYTTSPEGTAEGSVTYSRVWGKHALLISAPPTIVPGRPHAGVTVVWNRVPNAQLYVKRMRDEEREVDIFEANSYYQQKKVIANSAEFLQNAVV